MLVAAGLACRRGAEAPLTYFSEHGLSLRYPAGWKTGRATRDGVRYEYLTPPSDAGQPQLSVTLLGARTTASVDEYAASYLADEQAGPAQERPGASGRSWSFSSADGRTAGRLLLLGADGRIVGLHAQGEAAAVAGQAAALDEIWASVALERPADYPLHSWKDFDASLGVPASWKRTQQFSGRGTMLVQFASPPLGVEKRQTLHAALSLTLEPAPEGGLDAYYEATRRKLGENYAVASHEATADRIVDVMRTETPLAVSYIKRYYAVAGGRACSLSFEAREDVFAQAARWGDAIASTLRFGPTAGATSTGDNR